MPRYYFDILDSGELISDHVGVELEDEDTARSAAATVFAQLFAETESVPSRMLVAKVRDEAGQTILEVGIVVPMS